MHEHPTQALLDAFTIRQHKPRIEGLKVAIVGDLLHSRVLRSNVLLLTKLGAEVWVSGPPTLVPRGHRAARRPRHDLGRRGGRRRRRHHDAAHPAGADAGRVLPVAARVLQRLRPDHRAGRARAKPDVIIMHPGPMNRGVEIASEVADGPYSVILEQVANGVAVRMAVLYLLAGEVKRIDGRTGVMKRSA